MIPWEDLVKDDMSERVLVDVLLNFVRYEALQFTGLKSNSGVEVFEGDIIDASNYPRTIVRWNDEAGRIEPFNISDHEVIGNVYENSDFPEI
jgi:YopX protein